MSVYCVHCRGLKKLGFCKLVNPSWIDCAIFLGCSFYVSFSLKKLSTSYRFTRKKSVYLQTIAMRF